VVSQDNHQVVSDCLEPYRKELDIKQLKLNKKGLSFARNHAIQYMKGSLITFSDDDCWYPADAFQKVVEAFNQNLKSDVMCFQIYDPEKKDYYKSYSDLFLTKLNFRQVLQRSSIEIFIKLDNVRKNDLLFNERFGLGADYPSGEENIMLTNLQKQGYCLSYLNQVVVFHAKPSQKSRLNLRAFISKGPLFKQIFGPFVGFFMLTALFVKKYRSLERPIMFYFSAIKEMVKYNTDKKSIGE
jgi:glycosyltransferase involved in cell wall biosynthesis